jgi:hypothetical protein
MGTPAGEPSMKLSIFLVSFGTLLLVGSIMYSFEHWRFNQRSDAFWATGLGAGLLAAGIMVGRENPKDRHRNELPEDAIADRPVSRWSR